MLADVLAIVRSRPKLAAQPRLRAKPISRKSERPGRVPGSDAQLSQNPCSPLTGMPQLGQRASLDSGVSLSVGCPLRSSFQRSKK